MTDPDEDDPPPPKVMNAFIWVMLALSALCVIAGAVVAFYGPRLFAPAPAAASERLADGPSSAR
jgi:hypothetical protein